MNQIPMFKDLAGNGGVTSRALLNGRSSIFLGAKVIGG